MVNQPDNAVVDKQDEKAMIDVESVSSIRIKENDKRKATVVSVVYRYLGCIDDNHLFC